MGSALFRKKSNTKTVEVGDCPYLSSIGDYDVLTLTTGDANFDSVFGDQGKGIQFSRHKDPPGGTSVLIEGLTGTGKTILAAQLGTYSLYRNWSSSGCVVIYTLDQPPDEIIEMIKRFGWMDPGSMGEVPYADSVTDALRGNAPWRLIVK